MVFLFHIKYSIKIFSRTKVACDLFRGLSLYRNSSKSTRRFSCYGHRYCLVRIRFQASLFLFFSVRNEESPILSRTFFKTDWPKPKYIDKPYVDSRRKDKNNLTAPPSIKPATRSKKPTTPVNVLPKFTKSIYKDTIRNNMTAQITHLNLERLLLPTMASVFYEIERYHTDFATSKINMADTDSKLLTENGGKSMGDDFDERETLYNKVRYLLLTENEPSM